MRVGNAFGHVCLSVCVSVCVSVCSGITFEPLDIETSFLLYRYILTVSRSLGQGQGHMRIMISLLISTC